MQIMQATVPAAKILLVDGEFFSWYGSKIKDAPSYFEKLLEKILEKTKELL